MGAAVGAVSAVGDLLDGQIDAVGCVGRVARGAAIGATTSAAGAMAASAASAGTATVLAGVGLSTVATGTVVATAVTLLINSMAAFALAKYKFRGQSLILIVIVGTLMVPLGVIMVPLYSMISALGLFNSLWGVIWPTVATPTRVASRTGGWVTNSG